MPTRHTAPAFTVGRSSIAGAGQGLFAAVPIAAEDCMGPYTGVHLTWEALVSGPYAGSDYILAICSDHYIVAEGPEANYTRYINHSTEPNVCLIVSTRWKTARFEAISPIAPREEIFFNYGEDYWTSLPPYREAMLGSRELTT